MEDAAKADGTNGSAPNVDLLHAIIREQQAALEGLESSSRTLTSVLEYVLFAKATASATRQPVTNSMHAADPPPRSALSKRELEVLALMVEGKSSKQIGAQLGISFKTAVTHRASIMSKLGVHETASVVREAIRRGLVCDPPKPAYSVRVPAEARPRLSSS